MRTILVTVLLVAGPTSTVAPRRVQQLQWLSGCWEQRDARATVEEFWTSSRGGMLFGVGRTIAPKGASDTTTSFEVMRIYERDGKLVFAAQPAGEALTEFTERELTQNAVVFANPSHDFPQFVRYRRRGPNGLSARVDGTMDGKEMGFDSSYRRVACPR